MFDKKCHKAIQIAVFGLSKDKWTTVEDSWVLMWTQLNICILEYFIG